MPLSFRSSCHSINIKQQWRIIWATLYVKMKKAQTLFLLMFKVSFISRRKQTSPRKSTSPLCGFAEDFSMDSSGEIQPSQKVRDDQTVPTPTADDQAATVSTVKTLFSKVKVQIKAVDQKSKGSSQRYQPNSAKCSITLCKWWSTLKNHVKEIFTATDIYIKIVLFNLYKKKGEEFKTSNHPENNFQNNVHNNPETSAAKKLPSTHSPVKGLNLPQPVICQPILAFSSILIPVFSTLMQIISSTITTSSSSNQTIPKKLLATTLPGDSPKIINYLQNTNEKSNKSKSKNSKKTRTNNKKKIKT